MKLIHSLSSWNDQWQLPLRTYEDFYGPEDLEESKHLVHLFL